MESIQPCDWHEHDIGSRDEKEYVIDIYGRLPSGDSALLRVTGFTPYLYVGGDKRVPFSKQVEKYDVLAGFNGLKKTKVWRMMCNTLNQFFQNGRSLAEDGRTLYESNLPPFLRMIHEQHLNPGSPIQFEGKELILPPKPKRHEDDEDDDEPEFTVDQMFTCDYRKIAPAPTVSIPMKVASYDLEMYSASGQFPIPSRDPIIQIGVSFRWSNDLMTPTKKYVFVFGTVDPSDEPDTTFKGCKSEIDVLYSFLDCINSENPDIMCGYNTFGFDDGYIEGRCKVLGILEQMNLSRAPMAKKNTAERGSSKPVWGIRFTDTKKFELASGKYDLTPLAIRGRLGIDLLLNMRREHSLDSFKLDSVASVFLRDKVISYERGIIKTKSTRGLRNGSYVRFELVGNTSDPYHDGAKFIISSLTANSFEIKGVHDLFKDLTPAQRASIEWTFTKDDVEPQELFRLHREGGPSGRARIAKYCIQDCDLVLTLMNRLDTIVSARGMADVCKVPMSFVLTRGQGIKIFSAVVYYASQRDQILQTQESVDDDSSYEGAVVIQPQIGMYLDQPISVLDFNSLYPSNMIAYNLSPDTLVSRRVYDADHTVCIEKEGLTNEEIEKYEEEGFVMDEAVKYTDNDKKVVCRYIKPLKDNPQTVGILPKTLEIMLAKRKEYKNMMEDHKYDEAQRSVFNGLQLAYKVVANSIYGQCGSKTSAIRKLCVAACTTAVGRDRLHFAKKVVEDEFGAEVVYGDTDSIFIKFPTKSLEESIQLGIKAGKRITEQCRKAHKIAYEKTFYPFILFCRKRYVGIKYEEDPTKGKRMSMGIVLKRRDNAPIVKDVFGGAVDMLLQERDVKKAQLFVKDMLRDILDNKKPLDKFIISKSLRDDYKNPGQIAHRVLADRMAARDPGTAPKVGDRIQYIYVTKNKDAAKQGDRIEHIDYVRSNGLVPDTRFYITNQIQNPVAQLFALCIEKLDGYKEPRPTYASLLSDALEDCKGDAEEAVLTVLKQKEKHLDSLMFLRSPYLMNQKTLTGMWGK
uniref:DNA-directed DNA polymerase n=1 Tax=viral metagenome TaxID=1070528 RepID=A0A6C0J5S2_9ZZZZ